MDGGKVARLRSHADARDGIRIVTFRKGKKETTLKFYSRHSRLKAIDEYSLLGYEVVKAD